MKSNGISTFIAGSPHIRPEIEKRFGGRVINVFVGPKRGDIFGYLRLKLSKDETPDTMDEALEANILDRTPENILELNTEE